MQYDVAPCDGAGPVEALQEVRRPSDGLVALLVQRLVQADPVTVPVPWIGGEDVVQLQDGALVLESEALCEDRQPHADFGLDLIGGLLQGADSGPVVDIADLICERLNFAKRIRLNLGDRADFILHLPPGRLPIASALSNDHGLTDDEDGAVHLGENSVPLPAS